MKIAMVSPYALDVVGGVQSHVLALSESLVRLGEDVVVLAPSRAGLQARETLGGVRIIDLGRATTVPVNGSRAPIAVAPGIVRRVRREIRQLAPDLLHVHEPLVPLVGPAALLSESPARVGTFHAFAEGGALRRMYRLARCAGRPVIGRVDVLTAVSPVAASFHAAMLGLDVSTISVIPNGVDHERFATASRSRSMRDEVERLVFLGRLEPRKGPDVALDAFLTLAVQRPRLHLRVIGAGPLGPSLRARLHDAPLDVRHRVEFSGGVEPSALPGLLADADVAVLPARGGESFGIVLLEAMAAGLAVVATDITGYRPVARHEQEALLVPPGDAAALARSIARMMDDRPLRERLTQASRRRAATFDWPLVAQRVRAVYAVAAAH